MNPHRDFTSFTEVNSKGITDLPVKYKPIKALGDNTGETLGDPGFGKGYLFTFNSLSFLFLFLRLFFLKEREKERALASWGRGRKGPTWRQNESQADSALSGVEPDMGLCLPTLRS